VNPVQAVLDRLSDVRKSGSGWSARCPAHEDRRASLSVGEGNDGRALLKCHAGCDTSAILAAVGLELRDLFPEQTDWAAGLIARNGRSHGQPRAERPLGEGQTFVAARDALAALDRQLGRHSCYWTYTDAAGQRRSWKSTRPGWRWWFTTSAGQRATWPMKHGWTRPA
jgi:hypothetical protein